MNLLFSSGVCFSFSKFRYYSQLFRIQEKENEQGKVQVNKTMHELFYYAVLDSGKFYKNLKLRNVFYSFFFHSASLSKPCIPCETQPRK